jgi:hypothetical protein
MGSLADVAQMKTKLYDAKCSTTPCTQVDGIGCTGMVNKVYLIGAFLCTLPPPPPTHTPGPIQGPCRSTENEAERQKKSGTERERKRERGPERDRERERERGHRSGRRGDYGVETECGRGEGEGERCM